MDPSLVVIAITTIATTTTTTTIAAVDLMKAMIEKYQLESKFKLMFKLVASLPCE